MKPRGRDARIPAALLFAACAAAALLVPACTGKARLAVGGNPCTSEAQCAAGQACFLGACRGAAQALGLVFAEVRPPADSTAGITQVAAIDLAASVLVDLAAAEGLTVSGSILQPSPVPGAAPAPVAGAQLTFSSRERTIPAGELTATARSGATGSFRIRLPAGTWDADVWPPAPAPRCSAPLGLRTSSASVLVSLPSSDQLVPADGMLLSGGEPLAGVHLLPVAAGGEPLGASATSAADGTFRLRLPPGSVEIWLRAIPPDIPSPAAPQPAFDLLGPFPVGATSAPLVARLPVLPPPAALTGRVVDATGAPAARAGVFVSSLDGRGWTLARSTTTDEGGDFQLPLRAGAYAIEAAPGDGTPLLGLSAERTVQVGPDGPPVRLVCPRKVTATGRVLGPGGGALGAGVQIRATRRQDRLVSGRTGQVRLLDGAGQFQLVGDAGTWVVAVEPPAESGLPVLRLELSLPSGLVDLTLPDLLLPAPVEVVGTVRAASSQAPIPRAAVEYFAATPDGARAVSLGSALTDAEGRYRLVLADVAEPTAAGP